MSEFVSVTKKAGEIAGNPETLPEQEYNCPIHGKYTGIPMKYFGRVWNAACPECSKENEERRAREEKEWNEKWNAVPNEKSSEEEKEERERCFTEMNIGKKFWDESFDTFKDYTPDLQRYLKTCKTFAGNHKGRMLLMIGKNGNGKNHLAASILKETGGYIYSVFEIELLLKECYSGKNEETEAELYRRLCNAPMLAINEIGKHKSGEWETNFLSYIINKRYENLMPTIFITNAHLKDNCPQKNGCPECLQQFLGNDVLSRIVEDGEIMIFNEKDYRYKKREMRGE